MELRARVTQFLSSEDKKITFSDANGVNYGKKLVKSGLAPLILAIGFSYLPQAMANDLGVEKTSPTVKMADSKIQDLYQVRTPAELNAIIVLTNEAKRLNMNPDLLVGQWRQSVAQNDPMALSFAVKGKEEIFSAWVKQASTQLVGLTEEQKDPVTKLKQDGKITTNNLALGLVQVAAKLGVDALDLATIVSYETSGTLNPKMKGKRTKFGRHQGLIQWGRPQAKQYLNNDFSVASQLNGMVQYLLDAGVKPGMGRIDLYSAVNAGRVGLEHRSDARNGGAWGTVKDKVRYQMAGHEEKAKKLLNAVLEVDVDITQSQDSTPEPKKMPMYMTSRHTNDSPSIA